ncbi:dehydrogenase [Paraoerskovia sediminicola]|uniref:Dehydrogenase n=1 Tax=Paraoerskovia sediminicola TaxID=1138587 RepID=A0ABN6XA79_9CELL|nr:C-terminal binding protein [Paraoerskovia sediminicola]BDZ41664.1 dehydrogenase [Paraoerskovia sediminicola]
MGKIGAFGSTPSGTTSRPSSGSGSVSGAQEKGPLVAITECDHDSFAIEQDVVEAGGGELRITQSFTSDALVENCAGAQGIVVQYAKITAEVMDALPEMKVIGRYGVGVDSVDIAAATERGIAVCNVPDYGTEAVSDHALGLTLSVARGIPRLDRGVRAGSFDLPVVRPLYQTGKRVFGIIGMGLIGSVTARKAAGLGYEVIGYDSAADPSEDTFRGFPSVSLDELIERSQVISLHTPLNDDTRGMIGADEFARMRSDAIIVNTSRGGVVDTDALIDALERGAIAGAGIDVHEEEPVPVGHGLMAFDNVVLTPHLAWYTEESYEELKRRTVENVVEVCAGRAPRNIVNPEVLGAPGRCSAVPQQEGTVR